MWKEDIAVYEFHVQSNFVNCTHDNKYLESWILLPDPKYAFHNTWELNTSGKRVDDSESFGHGFVTNDDDVFNTVFQFCLALVHTELWINLSAEWT